MPSINNRKPAWVVSMAGSQASIGRYVNVDDCQLEFSACAIVISARFSIVFS